MKCAICKKKTTWDKSFGLRSYLVCEKCFFEEVKKNNGDRAQTLIEILLKGEKK